MCIYSRLPPIILVASKLPFIHSIPLMTTRTLGGSLFIFVIQITSYRPPGEICEISSFGRARCDCTRRGYSSILLPQSLVRYSSCLAQDHPSPIISPP